MQKACLERKFKTALFIQEKNCWKKCADQWEIYLWHICIFCIFSYIFKPLEIETIGLLSKRVTFLNFTLNFVVAVPGKIKIIGYNGYCCYICTAFSSNHEQLQKIYILGYWHGQLKSRNEITLKAKTTRSSGPKDTATNIIAHQCPWI